MKQCHFYHKEFKIDENHQKIQKDLIKCPICNAKPNLIFPMRFIHNANHSKIQCSNCGSYVLADTMQEAIDYWNNKYIITKEEKDLSDFSCSYSNLNYIDDDIDFEQYFYTHISCGHPFDGNSIYAVH